MTAQTLPGDLTLLIAEYLAHRRARGAARNTLLAYGADLRNLQAYLARHDVTLVQLLSERLLNCWLDEGLLHHGWHRRTAARKLEAVRGFVRWCIGERITAHDPCEHVRIKFRPRRVIAPELQPLKDVVARIGTTHPLDLRDRAMLMLLLDAALRASEVVLLDVPMPGRAAPPWHVDVQHQRVYARPKGGEGDESEIVGIEEQTVRAVQAWMAARPAMQADGEAALFVNQQGHRISRQSLYTVVRDRGAAAGLPNLHPHLFRHRRVGDVVEKLGIKVGAALARHRHESTTVNVYGAHAAEVQRNAVRQMAPLGDIPCNA